MEITRVKIDLCDDDRVKAYASITLDDCFGEQIVVSKLGSSLGEQIGSSLELYSCNPQSWTGSPVLPPITSQL